jgi:hypothetical protein
MVDVRRSANYKERRNAIVLAMVQRISQRTGRPISTDEWRQFVADLIGPAPPMDHDAAGNTHNPAWWLHYALTPSTHIKYGSKACECYAARR